jgi:hypothetical protein
MTDHDHTSPGQAVHQAVLGLARTVALSDPAGAAEVIADSRGACPWCAAVAGIQFGYAVCASLTGAPFVTEPLRARILAAIDAAQAALREAGN